MNQRSIHSYTWVPQWSMDDGAHAIERAAALGYGYIVVPLRRHEDIDPAGIAKLCADAGIKPITTSPLGPHNDISSTDSAVSAAGVAHHLAGLELAAAMGADRMGGILYSAFGKATRRATPENFSAAAEGLAKVAERARSLGMLISLEVVNRYETNLITTAADAVRMVKTIGMDNVKVHLDTFHMNIEENSMMGALEEALPYLGYFEIDQNHRGLLSQGQIDFAPLLKRLKDASYTGLIGVEAFSSAVSHPDIAAGVGAWRDLFSNGDDVAREGADLLAAHGF